MDAVNLAVAKAHFSELVNRVEAGESIEITRRGKGRRPAHNHCQAPQAYRCSDTAGADGDLSVTGAGRREPGAINAGRRPLLMLDLDTSLIVAALSNEAATDQNLTPSAAA